MPDIIGRCAFVKSFHQNYLSYVYHGIPLKLPAVHVRLINPKNNKSVRSFALVDSGATVSFVPLEFAQMIDLELGEESSATGAGGDFATNLSVVKIQVVKGASIQYQDEIQVHIPQEEGKIPYIVLGRNSIFLYFDITIRENKQDIVFRRIKRIKRT